MKRNRLKKARKKRKKEARHTQSPTSLFDSALRLLRTIDRNRFIFVVLLILFLFLGTHIRLNFKRQWPVWFQMQHLNPDAKLYYSLAQNIVDGTGYFDTYRNAGILPSVGHPLLLAFFCVILGLSPATFAWVFLFSSFVILAIAIRIYTSSNILTICALWLYAGFFAHIRQPWLSGNVESSIVFANAILILSLIYFYKNNFQVLWAVISGAALAIHLLIRPLYLFPTHICFIILLGAVLYFYLRKRLLGIPKFVQGWFLLLATAEAILFLTLSYSQIRYSDSRLVTGTYGAYSLYRANNIHLDPEAKFNSRAKHPEEFDKVFTSIADNPELDWKQRQKKFMQETIDYWKSYPGRALRGWWWRFRQFIGVYSGNFSWKHPLTVMHAISASTLFALIFIRMIAARISKAKKMRLIYSPGLLLAALFILYSAIHSVFTYSEFRYVAVTIPLLVASNFILLFEAREIFVKLWSAVISFSSR